MPRVNGSSGMSRKHDGDEQQRPGQLPPAVVVLPRGPEQEDPAQDRAAELARREAEPDVLPLHGHQARGAVRGGDPERHEHRR